MSSHIACQTKGTLLQLFLRISLSSKSRPIKSHTCLFCLPYPKHYFSIPMRCTSGEFFQLILKFVVVAMLRKFPYIQKDIGPVLHSRLLTTKMRQRCFLYEDLIIFCLLIDNLSFQQALQLFQLAALMAIIKYLGESEILYHYIPGSSLARRPAPSAVTSMPIIPRIGIAFCSPSLSIIFLAILSR